jgi:hypothetical protein
VDAVGSEEAVVDALLEAVGVNRVAEVEIGVAGDGLIRAEIYHRQREVAGIAEEIIGAFAWAAPSGWTLGDDAARGEKALFGNGVRVIVPAGLLQQRHDELAACVGLGHGVGAR